MPPGTPTLRELRRATSDKVSPYLHAISGVEQTDGTYAGTERSNNRRCVISTDLASLSADGQYGAAPSDYIKNEYLLVCSQPIQQRRIPAWGFNGTAKVEEAAQGYDPALAVGADPIGVVTLERPLPFVVAPGLDLEIHGIPPLRAGKSAGLHAAINHALRVTLREDTLLVPGVMGSNVIDVTAIAPWLTNVGQFVDATYPETQQGIECYRIPGASLRFDADRVLLSPNGMTSEQIPVRVLRPASSWIKPAATGVWGESVVGLVDDLDQCLGDLDQLALLAAFHVADGEARACVVGSPEMAFWAAQARSFAQRLPGLKDQRTRRPRTGLYPWPDLISVDGPLGGRYGPGWR